MGVGPSSESHKAKYNVAVLGAAGGIGQTLSLFALNEIANRANEHVTPAVPHCLAWLHEGKSKAAS